VSASFDVVDFVYGETVDEKWARAWAARLFDELSEPEVVQNHLNWQNAVDEHREDVDVQLQHGEIQNTGTAAPTWFVLDLLQVAGDGDDSAFRGFILGYVLQIALSDRLWQEIIHIPPDRAEDSDAQRVTLSTFPWAILPVLFRRRKFVVLTNLYALIRDRIKTLRVECIEGSASYELWLHSLVKLSIALRERHYVPIQSGSEWHPVAQMIFTPERLTQERRDEAFFAEQFAHLATSILQRRREPDFLARVTREFEAVPPDARLQARQDLRLMRSRLELPLYVFKEIESHLRMAAPPPVEGTP
jgi:hypothetical protein